MANYIDKNELLNAIDKRNGRLPLWLDEILMQDCKVADVAPVVHGHWEQVAGMNSKCSVCERYFPVNEFVKRPFDINHCPNCGAKMDEEEQE